MGWKLPFYGFLVVVAVLAAGLLPVLSPRPDSEPLEDSDGTALPGIEVVPGVHDLTMSQFLRLLWARRLPLHVTPVSRGKEDLSQGFYLTERVRPWEELNALPREITAAPRWTGVVIVDRRNQPIGFVPEVVEGWGRHGMIAGQLLLFGDPAILAQVRELLKSRVPSRNPPS